MIEIYQYEEGEDNYNSFILEPTVNVLDEIQPIVNGPRGNVLFWSMDFTAWGTESALHNLNIYGIRPGSNVARKLQSPFIEAVTDQNTNGKWFDLFYTVYDNARKQGVGSTAEIQESDVKKSLESIILKGGVAQEVVLNHAPFMLRWALKQTLQGVTIVSFDIGMNPDDRQFAIWDSKLNRMRDDETVKKTIEDIKIENIDELTLPVFN